MQHNGVGGLGRELALQGLPVAGDGEGAESEEPPGDGYTVAVADHGAVARQLVDAEGEGEGVRLKVVAGLAVVIFACLAGL